MKTEEEIKKELKKRLKLIGKSGTNLETLIHCDWFNCLEWVLEEERTILNE